MVSSPSIFTNMPSLLNKPASKVPWPISLELPNIFTEPSDTSEVLPFDRPLKEITACPHTSRRNYAKSMCSSCYHKYGREKLAWMCYHKTRPHYAKGRCQYCYLKQYYRKRRD